MSALTLAFDMTPAHVSPAGVGRYTNGIRAALAKHPDVNLVLLSATSAFGRGLAGRAARGILREGLYYPFQLARGARRGGAQLVHVPAPYGPRVGGLPLVMSAHDVMPLSLPELFTRAMTAHMRYVSVRHLRKADWVVCGSEHARRELVELVGVAPERVSATPYGVDARFRPTPRDPEWLRRRFGVEGRYVLCVGTLEPRKNLVNALRAFGRVLREEADCWLVLVGERGWRNEAFERELGEVPDRVVLTGRVDDDELVRLYGAAACLLFPSLGEGIGFPVIEAMACGTPVVTSDRTSLPELAGDAALLRDPTDANAIAEGVLRVLQDGELADSLRERGLRRARGHTWAACADATVAVYRKVLATRA